MFRALLYNPCFALYAVQPELRPFFLAAGRPLPDPLDPPGGTPTPDGPP